MHHTKRNDWLFTAKGDPRGYIQPQLLRELWFHTGTICNLKCPFCLEGSRPGDNRLEKMTLADIQPFIHEALELGVEQFSFTGGEPFVVPEFVKILDYALDYRPCLVLTNATEPLMNRMADVLRLGDKPHPLSFRVSLDYPDPERHDAGRGKGNFRKTLKTLSQLHRSGFHISIARQEAQGENREAVNREFIPYFEEFDLPADIHFVVFPDFLPPGAKKKVPYITQDCMTRYKTEATRAEFMCNYSKMIVKTGGRMRVYACTLVDDDPDYDLGGTLTEAMPVRVMLRHHRCYDCFSSGASCSELNVSPQKMTEVKLTEEVAPG